MLLLVGAHLDLVKERFEQLLDVLKAYLFVGLKNFPLPLSTFRVYEVEPVFLVAVLEFAEVAPVRTHQLLVVVLDERLEDSRLLLVARVNFGEQCIDKQSIDNNRRLLVPNGGARHIQRMPVAHLDLIHEQLGCDCVHLQKQGNLLGA